LPGAEYHALTATADFLQQFIIAELSEQLLCGRFLLAVGLSIRIAGCNIFSGAAVLTGDYGSPFLVSWRHSVEINSRFARRNVSHRPSVATNRSIVSDRVEL
jgi:hypothetical protein